MQAITMPSCKVCEKESITFKCGRCFNISYCSKNCQIADWKQHKHSCKPTTTSAPSNSSTNLLTTPPKPLLNSPTSNRANPPTRPIFINNLPLTHDPTSPFPKTLILMHGILGDPRTHLTSELFRLQLHLPHALVLLFRSAVSAHQKHTHLTALAHETIFPVLFPRTKRTCIPCGKPAPTATFVWSFHPHKPRGSMKHWNFTILDAVWMVAVPYCGVKECCTNAAVVAREFERANLESVQAEARMSLDQGCLPTWKSEGLVLPEEKEVRV